MIDCKSLTLNSFYSICHLWSTAAKHVKNTSIRQNPGFVRNIPGLGYLAM